VKQRLDRTRQRHGVLEYTGRCRACGRDVSEQVRAEGQIRFYCSQECMWRRPPKMVLAEEAWGRSFAELALEHLNRGGTLNSLADMCGVHRQAVYSWLERVGVVRHVEWRRKGVAS